MGTSKSPGSRPLVLSLVLMLSLALGALPAAAQDDAPAAPDTVQDAPEPVATVPPPPPPTDPPPPPPTDPPPVATDPPPAATEPPVIVETPVPATEAPVTPAPTESTGAGVIPPTDLPDGTETPVPTETPTPSPTPTPTPPPPAALGLPWPYPGPIGADPSGDISLIWGYLGFGVSQEYGRTAFSLAHPDWYDYGADFGLDGVSHPGLDVSMPRGTWLFSPVNGTVVVSGGSAGFTFYGNGNYGVGELRIRANDGNEVVLGHMGRIAVGVGDYVTVGQFVGVSGGFNGDHLHLEARQNMGGWFQIVDPRGSFLIGSIADQAAQAEVVETESEPAAVEVATMVPLAPEEVAATIGGERDDLTTRLNGDEPEPTSQVSADGGDAPAVNAVQTQAQQVGQQVMTNLVLRGPEEEHIGVQDAHASIIDVALDPVQESMAARVAVLASKVTTSGLADLSDVRSSP